MGQSNKIEIANVSDVGKRRPHNEDSTLSELEQGLVILADGMGGYKAGEVASAIAVTSIHGEVIEGLKNIKPTNKSNSDSPLSAQSELVKNAIINANSSIYNSAQTDEQCHGMGTTVVASLFHDHVLSVAHVGDSRLYRLRGNDTKELPVPVCHHLFCCLSQSEPLRSSRLESPFHRVG